MKYSPAAILYNSYLKYGELDLLLLPYIEQWRHSNKEVVVVIDLYQAWDKLYVKVAEPNSADIVSATINHALNYRNYFRKRGLYSYIIFVYSPHFIQNCLSYLPEWNSKYILKVELNPLMTEAQKEAFSLMNTIIPYLPDIYIKNSLVETALTTYHLAQLFTTKHNTPLIMESNNPLYCQTLAHCSNAYFLNDSVRARGLYDSSRFVEAYYRSNDRNIKYLDPVLNNPMYLTVIMLLMGITKRSIEPILKEKQVLHIIKELEGSHIVPSMDVLSQIVSEVMQFIKNDPRAMLLDTNMKARYMAIDLMVQYEKYKLLPDYSEMSFLQQLNDPKTLYDLNQQYFTQAPLNLSFL